MRLPKDRCSSIVRESSRSIIRGIEGNSPLCYGDYSLCLKGANVDNTWINTIGVRTS